VDERLVGKHCHHLGSDDVLELTPRATPSVRMAYLSPALALVATVVMCAALFALLGQSPARGLALFFVEPFAGARALGELTLKATPLLLIGAGLALSFRANVWNVGAEGQFIAGALCAARVALVATESTSPSIVIPILCAGVLGGMAWAAVPAVLKDRFGASEILVSLMLVYVAEQLLGYLVFGPWRDPAGHNFPQTSTFADATRIPRLLVGSRANIGLVLALVLAGGTWLFAERTRAGFALQVGGASPPAARHAGYSARRALWLACLISGGLAGLAGALEVAGPLGQLTPHVPAGYGFTAIIVAFVGRLSPLGAILSSLLLSLFHIGGELAQSRMALPKSISLVFQGLLLFSLLASDTFIHRRLRWRRSARPAPALAAPGQTSSREPPEGSR
jgi:simple sugar transport system permease protein